MKDMDDKKKYSSLVGIAIVALWAMLLLFIMLSKLKEISIEYGYDMFIMLKEMI